MDASGKDDVLLETVGVGQAEVDIIDHADTVVLVLMPGSGDSIQALKAGVMEIPDIIVVNKADHPLTDTMVREIRGVLSLGPQERLARADRPPRLRGRGGRELAEQLADPPRVHRGGGHAEERRRRNLMNEVLGIATDRLRRKLEERSATTPRSQALLDEVVARRLDPASAATRSSSAARQSSRKTRYARERASARSPLRCRTNPPRPCASRAGRRSSWPRELA